MTADPLYAPMIIGGQDIRYELTNTTVTDYRGRSLYTIPRAAPVVVKRAIQNARLDGVSSLRALGTDGALDIFRNAADIFEQGEVPVGDVPISPEDHIKLVVRSTGLPYSTVKKSLGDIANAMRGMGYFLYELTYGQQNLNPRGTTLGAITPQNHPSVNILPLSALAAGYGLLVRPSDHEVLTNYRALKSLYEAGLPSNTAYLITGPHDLVSTVLAGNGLFENEEHLGLIFGNQKTVDAYTDNDRVKARGPGRSLCYAEYIDDDGLNILERSAAGDGGRGCINLSGLLVARGKGKEVSQQLARRLARYPVLDPLDPEAVIPAFADKDMSYGIHFGVDNLLSRNGAEDVTAKYRKRAGIIQRPWLVESHDTRFLLPLVAYCEHYEHPAFGREFLFPYVAVAEASRDDFLQAVRELHPLVVTLLTHDQGFVAYVRSQKDTWGVETVRVNKATNDMSIDDPTSLEGFSLIPFLYEPEKLLEKNYL